LLCIFRGRIASLPETGCCGTSGTAAPPDEEAAAEHGPFPIEQLQGWLPQRYHLPALDSIPTRITFLGCSHRFLVDGSLWGWGSWCFRPPWNRVISRAWSTINGPLGRVRCAKVVQPIFGECSWGLRTPMFLIFFLHGNSTNAKGMKVLPSDFRVGATKS